MGAWGFLLSALGLLVSIVGFSLTIWQLVRTASATRAAGAAVDRLKLRVATYDAIFEISRARSAIKETQSNARGSDWRRVVESYATTREALLRVRELSPHLDDKQRDKIDDVIEEINRFCDRVESSLQKGAIAFDVAKAIRAIRSHSDFVDRLRITMERSA